MRFFLIKKNKKHTHTRKTRIDNFFFQLFFQFCSCSSFCLDNPAMDNISSICRSWCVGSGAFGHCEFELPMAVSAHCHTCECWRPLLPTEWVYWLIAHTLKDHVVAFNWPFGENGSNQDSKINIIKSNFLSTKTPNYLVSCFGHIIHKGCCQWRSWT